MAHAAFERRWAEKQPAFGGWLTENSTAALDAYASHPEHLRVKQELADLRIARHQVDYAVTTN